MKKIKKLIPTANVFKNRKDEAKFWETHFDTAMAQGVSKEAVFAKNLSETVNVRLDSKTLKSVRSEAKSKGLGPTQLIRMWIMEKIGRKYVRV